MFDKIKAATFNAIAVSTLATSFSIGIIPVKVGQVSNVGVSEAIQVSLNSSSGGSCYRLDRFINNWSGKCVFPVNSDYNYQYNNLKSISWVSYSNSVPATVTFYTPGKSYSYCNLGRTLHFAGNFTCFNPRPYEPTIIIVKPIYNQSISRFIVNPR